VATGEPDPAEDPRWLGDEVIDDQEERELEAIKTATVLSQQERLHTLFTSPEWPTLRDVLQQEVDKSRVSLESAEGELVKAYQARIRVLKWLLELPEKVAGNVKFLTVRLETETRQEAERKE